jgi:acyl carrier protein
VEIKTEVRKFVADNFLPNAPLESINDSMPLISGGVIDSIGMIGLVSFLETHFEVEFMPREVDVHNLDTLERIEEVMRKKLAGRVPDAPVGQVEPAR